MATFRSKLEKEQYKKLEKEKSRIKRWQDKNTGHTNIILKKLQSSVILNELCPWCEFRSGCNDQEISTTGTTDTYRLCQLKSWDLTTVWVRVTENRPKVEIGSRYSKLTVINFDQSDRHGNLIWRCLCDCGKYKSIRGDNLIKGNVISCGCSRGGDRRSSEFQSSGSNIYNIEKKKSNYRIGSDTNPDGTLHKYPSEHSSKIGCKYEVLVEREEEDRTIREYVDLHCDECGHLMRWNDHSELQCENCGLIS